MPGVTVVVLSYNGTADTLACLASLLDDDPDFDVLVVDNASTDGAPAAIRARYPTVPILELPDNRGWAGGNNAGIARASAAGAELVCLLNNDTVVPRGAIAGLAAASRRFGPCLMHPAIDYADPAEGAQLDPSIAGAPLEQGGDVYPLGYAYGACLMVPVTLFAQIGCLDERFFLQLEETDFWLRAKAAGVASLCQTSVRIVHAESRSFGGRTTPLKTYYIIRNTLLLTEKHDLSPVGIGRAARSIYWQLAKSAGRGNKAAILRWAVSGDAYAVAARLGARDYVLRRFGSIGQVARQAIAGP